jgi:hypothetical protein
LICSSFLIKFDARKLSGSRQRLHLPNCLKFAACFYVSTNFSDPLSAKRAAKVNIFSFPANFFEKKVENFSKKHKKAVADIYNG